MKKSLILGVNFKFFLPRICFIFLFFSSQFAELKAFHIIGGEMYYDCLGYGKDSLSRRYLITIKLYRDCRPQQSAAPFDEPLGFTIYRRNANGNGYTIIPGGGSGGGGPKNEFSIPKLTSGPDEIPPPTYPCLLLPPDICVEDGTYEYIVELPIITEEYVITWQRCCRNNTITNIINPGATGITFTISIHPEAQKTCNSSPRFKNFPPTVVCVNNPLNFDHSAIDKEGDLLVYSFCEPFAGGSSGGGGGGPNSCANNTTGTTPNPDCPPPYVPVIFKAPQYSYIFPMGGNPPVTINSLTGLITGEPNTIGQFVVSVCCSEYRNGVLLSTLKRDFQFNVAGCQGTVVAQLGNAKEVTRQNYEILLCNKDTIQMKNSSYDSTYISGIQWEIENGGKIETSNLWNPKFKFKEGGIHNGRFILNPSTNCSDTANFVINAITDIKSDFSFSYDSCKAGPVEFTDLSTSSYSKLLNWQWDLGDGFKSFEQNFNLQYINPDEYAIKLDIIDNFGCKATNIKKLKWFPAPQVIVFKPSVNEGCVPLKVNFKNVSFPTDSTYKFVWKFSDGTLNQGTSFFRTFDSVGLFSLKLEVTSPLGCYNEGIFNDIIKVDPPPTAVWSINKDSINLSDPLILGFDSTLQTVGRSWIIDNKEYFFDKELAYMFNDTGYHSIKMIVSDKFLCTDTLETFIYTYRDFTLFMPNAFTPNGDGINETFAPVGQINSLESYQLRVYDRWGGIQFESSNPNIGWNGKFGGDGKDLEAGVYIYTLEYKNNRKPLVILKKPFTLIR